MYEENEPVDIPDDSTIATADAKFRRCTCLQGEAQDCETNYCHTGYLEGCEDLAIAPGHACPTCGEGGGGKGRGDGEGGGGVGGREKTDVTLQIRKLVEKAVPESTKKSTCFASCFVFASLLSLLSHPK